MRITHSQVSYFLCHKLHVEEISMRQVVELPELHPAHERTRASAARSNGDSNPKVVFAFPGRLTIEARVCIGITCPDTIG